jgi:hydrogenase/urease accessory protein HupE
MQTMSHRLVIVLLSALPALAQAHPGHSVVDGWAHWFTPDHVLPALVAVGILVYFLVRRKDRE